MKKFMKPIDLKKLNKAGILILEAINYITPAIGGQAVIKKLLGLGQDVEISLYEITQWIIQKIGHKITDQAIIDLLMEVQKKIQLEPFLLINAYMDNGSTYLLFLTPKKGMATDTDFSCIAANSLLSSEQLERRKKDFEGLLRNMQERDTHPLGKEVAQSLVMNSYPAHLPREAYNAWFDRCKARSMFFTLNDIREVLTLNLKYMRTLQELAAEKIVTSGVFFNKTKLNPAALEKITEAENYFLPI